MPAATSRVTSREEALAIFQQDLAPAQRFSTQERVAGLTANLDLVAARRGETSLAIQYLF